MTSDIIDSSIIFISLRGVVKETDVLYWSQHFQRTLTSTMTTPTVVTTPTSESIFMRFGLVFPVTMVTQIEVSDVLIDINLDNQLLCPEKGSLCQFILANAIIKVDLTHFKHLRYINYYNDEIIYFSIVFPLNSLIPMFICLV